MIVAFTLLTIVTVALCVLSLCLYFYAKGCKADYEEARDEAKYYYQLADKYQGYT